MCQNALQNEAFPCTKDCYLISKECSLFINITSNLFCYSNFPTIKQKNSLFQQPIVLSGWHINNNRWRNEKYPYDMLSRPIHFTWDSPLWNTVEKHFKLCFQMGTTYLNYSENLKCCFTPIFSDSVMIAWILVKMLLDLPHALYVELVSMLDRS